MVVVSTGSEERGWIKGSWVEKAGERRRRFYRLTTTGQRVLARQRETWDEFVEAVRLVTRGERTSRNSLPRSAISSCAAAHANPFEVSAWSITTGAPPTTTRVQALPWPIAYFTVG